jgi:hypothetical protein
MREDLVYYEDNYFSFPSNITVDIDPTPERVPTKEIQDLAISFNCPLWEVSAVTGQNIEESIKSIIKEVKKYKENQYFFSGEKKSRKELHNPSIPPFLDARNQPCANTRVVSEGALISTYQNVGTHVVNTYDGKQVTYFPNASPILYPLGTTMFSLLYVHQAEYGIQISLVFIRMVFYKVWMWKKRRVPKYRWRVALLRKHNTVF